MGHGGSLTRAEAGARARLVSEVGYDVELDLAGGDPEAYRSTTTVRFRCAEPGASTFLDLAARSVEGVRLNGREVPAGALDGDRIRLDGLDARNEVRVVATPSYGRTGVGMHRFEDPVDGRVYVYNHFEPYAHRIFPCFDQPDLKAVFTLSVLAPPAWQVVSNSRLDEEPAAAPGGAVRWSFAPTPPIPTYVTAVVAGPWHVVRDRSGAVELGLWCRQSLARHLDPEEFLAVTRQGFRFFERAFARPYPFGAKYDQVLVPEFGGGAMEQAACVTFDEEFVFRSKVTDAAREVRANVVLHELAHMWFGNLVTMRWWDDLWLNESFASFISVLAQVAATRFTDGWVTFAQTEKTWAYEQDQLPSTHPIATEVPDTDTVFTNFDGITYAKGAAVLRQLVAWVGEEAFLRGVRAYFQRHEFGSTGLGDFLDALGDASARDLKSWSRAWLETAGVNTLATVLEVTGSAEVTGPAPDRRIGSFAIIQTAPAGHPVLRPHRVTVGLYDRDGGTLALRKRLELDVTGPVTPVPELAGEPAPDLALLNDADLAYAKVRLDPGSLSVLTGAVGALRDPLARAVGWGICWDMVRDAELATSDHLRMVLANAEAEDHVGVLADVLDRLGHAVDVFGDPAARPAARASLAGLAQRVLGRAEPGSGRQLAWAKALVATAETEEQLRLLRALLDGAASVPGLAVDTDLRWAIVRSLAAGGAAGDELISGELRRDPTDDGRRHAAGARAARPLPEAKAEAWAVVTGPAGPARPLQSAVELGFQQAGQRELLEPYAARFFAALDPLAETRDLESLLAFARAFYPRLVAGDEVVAMTDAWLASHPDAGPVRRRLVEGSDRMRRALRARARDRATS
ncbi:MAG TPA: aminopeptidase N [Actinomycetota bacterium]|nr:aminopeptidase N [Actinomycetota bacterium]